MNRRNQPGNLGVFLFQGNLAGRGVFLTKIDPAAALRKSLFLDVAQKGLHVAPASFFSA